KSHPVALPENHIRAFSRWQSGFRLANMTNCTNFIAARGMRRRQRCCTSDRLQWSVLVNEWAEEPPTSITRRLRRPAARPRVLNGQDKTAMLDGPARRKGVATLGAR